MASQLRHRTTSPLIGAYVLSWLLVNYQIPILIFSELAVERKLVLLGSILKPDHWPGLWSCYGLPLVVTIIFIFIYPLLSRPIYWWWHWQQNLLIATRKRIEDERPLTREEEQAVRKEIWAQASRHVQELRERDQRIKDLEERLEVSGESESENGSNTYGDNASPYSAKLTDEFVLNEALGKMTEDQIELLRAFYQNDGSIYLHKNFESGKPSVEVRHAAQVLEEMGLAKLGVRIWNLTARGNAVAVHAAKSLWK